MAELEGMSGKAWNSWKAFCGAHLPSGTAHFSREALATPDPKALPRGRRQSTLPSLTPCCTVSHAWLRAPRLRTSTENPQRRQGSRYPGASALCSICLARPLSGNFFFF